MGRNTEIVTHYWSAKAKEMIFTGKMINAEEAYKIGLVNDVIQLTQDELPEAAPEGDEVKRKEYEKKLAKLLNKKLIEKSIFMAREITNNSYNAIKVSKYLINKGMDMDIDFGLEWKYMDGPFVLLMKIEKI